MNAGAFERAWRSLSGMWYRQDNGLLTGRNAEASRLTEVARFVDLDHAFYALDTVTNKQKARHSYAERRVKLGRADAERFKAFAKDRGEW